MSLSKTPEKGPEMKERDTRKKWMQIDWKVCENELKEEKAMNGEEEVPQVACLPSGTPHRTIPTGALLSKV